MSAKAKNTGTKQDETLVYYIRPDHPQKAVEKIKIKINHLPIHNDTYDERPNTRLAVIRDLLKCKNLELHAFSKDGCAYQLWFDDEFTLKKGLPFNEAATKLCSKLSTIEWQDPNNLKGWFLITKERHGDNPATAACSLMWTCHSIEVEVE